MKLSKFSEIFFFVVSIFVHQQFLDEWLGAAGRPKRVVVQLGGRARPVVLNVTLVRQYQKYVELISANKKLLSALYL